VKSTEELSALQIERFGRPSTLNRCVELADVAAKTLRQSDPRFVLE
jgi:hypothetical protein